MISMNSLPPLDIKDLKFIFHKGFLHFHDGVDLYTLHLVLCL